MNASAKWTTLLFLLLLSLPSNAVPADSPDSPAPSDSTYFKLRPYAETGVLAGGESGTPIYYTAATVRLLTEAGLELRRVDSHGKIVRSYGLALSGTLGGEEGRISFGPRVTWRFRPDLSLLGTVGPVWSSEEESSGHLDQGWQIRSGILYQNVVSVDLLWQTLPYDADPPVQNRGGRIHAFYGGMMFHGGAGLIASAVVWGTFAALFVVYAATYSGG